eukprot:CAMPEP_0167763154 /NCGR_PEP_ID=MMETSP0110_2-20121227/13189_1 /TAXON_ID=629695 /ORGANISM="Gymnochlora sp., Strain CCMP2014" /LENGTH=196 /DNA_ID=CAMNT_0007650155 /DNA_START=241 /DNA_END=834 /DNA_ORIENTATION=+
MRHHSASIDMNEWNREDSELISLKETNPNIELICSRGIPIEKSSAGKSKEISDDKEKQILTKNLQSVTEDHSLIAAHRKQRRRKWAVTGKRKGVSTRRLMEQEKDRQEALQREILDLTEVLKKLQMEVQKFFQKDNETIDSVMRKMEDNKTRTLAESKRLDEYSSRSMEICRTWSLLVFVVTSFVAIFIFIRTFPL